MTKTTHASPRFAQDAEWQCGLLASILKHPELFEALHIPRLDYGAWTGHLGLNVAKSIVEHYRNAGTVPTLTTVRAMLQSRLEQNNPDQWLETTQYLDKLAEMDVRDATTYAATLTEFFRRGAIQFACRAALTDLEDGKSVTLDALNRLHDDLLSADTKAAKAKSVLEIISTPPPVEEWLLGKGRWVCRGGGCLVPAYTGLGKSSLLANAVALWSVGREAFGIPAARPLKILVIQSENDDGDLHEQFVGAAHGNKLTDAELDLMNKNVAVLTHDETTGDDFIAFVSVQLKQHEPDLLFLDCLNSYLGADSAKAEVVARFFRAGLNPLLHRYGCACIVIHHANKPKNDKNEGAMLVQEMAYEFSGSNDIANWARAILVIKPTASPKVFRFVAAKRGKRIGWTDANGQPTTVKHFAHSDDGLIYWREPTMLEMTELQEAEQERKKAKRGVIELYSDEQLLGALKEGALTFGDWLENLNAHGCGISKGQLSKRKDAFLDKCSIREEAGKKFALVKRPGRKEPQV
jgi:hypothetical protein